jgi:NADH-quinone oxidoreductase subunit C
MTPPDGQEPEPTAARPPGSDAGSPSAIPQGANPAEGGEAAATPAPKVDKPARPAKEPEPKTAPRVAPPAGSVNEIVAAAAAGVSFDAYLVPELGGQSVAIEVARDDIPAVMAACRDDVRLDLKYLRCLSGVDWQDEGLEVVYHLFSFSKHHKLTIKTRVSYDDANVPSVASIFPAAEWHEREARDMFGINFPGHPDPRPLLLPEDMTDHFPLRKDNPLQEIEEWQGEHLVEGAGEDE